MGALSANLIDRGCPDYFEALEVRESIRNFVGNYRRGQYLRVYDVFSQARDQIEGYSFVHNQFPDQSARYSVARSSDFKFYNSLVCRTPSIARLEKDKSLYDNTSVEFQLVEFLEQLGICASRDGWSQLKCGVLCDCLCFGQEEGKALDVARVLEWPWLSLWKWPECCEKNLLYTAALDLCVLDAMRDEEEDYFSSLESEQ